MNVSLFLVFLSSVLKCSKADIEKILIEKTHKKIFCTLLIFLVVVVLVTLFGTFGGEISQQPTTFNVSVVAEEVSVRTKKTSMSHWPVKNVLLSESCPDDPDDISSKNFTGSIQLNPDVAITLTRIGEGKLTVSFLSAGEQSGVLFDDEDERVGALSKCAFFEINGIADMVKNGETIVLPVTGDIIAGREIRFLSYYKVPVLRTGSVSILNKTFLSVPWHENYVVDPVKLYLGDSFEILKPTVPSQGFVLIDADLGIKLTYRAKGYSGVIHRYQAGAIQLRNTVWSRLYYDETLSLMWLLSLTLYGFIRLSIRSMVE